MRKPSIKHVLLFGVIAGLVLTWVLMGELLQGLQVGWQKPWFITYSIRAGYMMWLPIWVILRICRVGRNTFWLLDYSIKFGTLVKVAMGLQTLGSIGGMTWYLSLPLTTVAANNSVYQSSSAFVFVLSALVLKERVTWTKAVAVALSIGGVIVISFAEASGNPDVAVTPSESALGYMWVSLSTLLYAVYEVTYSYYTEHLPAKKREDAAKELLEETEMVPLRNSPNDGSPTFEYAAPLPPLESPYVKAEFSALFLGVMGVFMFIAYWPMFFIFDKSGYEEFELPFGRKVELLVGNVLLDGTFNALLLFGVQLTSPLIISVGTMFVIPAGIIADYLFHGTMMSWKGGVGVVMVVLGFVFLQLRLPPLRALCTRRAHEAL